LGFAASEEKVILVKVALNPNTLRKVISAAAVLVGLFWIVVLVFPIVFTWEKGDHFGNLLMISLSFAMSIPGVILIRSGVRLWREMSVQFLGGAVGGLCIVGVFVLSSVIDSLFSRLFPSSGSQMSCVIFFSAFSMVPVYLLAMRFSLKHLTGEHRRASEFVGRGLLGTLAFVAWMGMGDVAEIFGKSYEQSPSTGTLVYLLPVFLAWVFYRVGCWWFCTGRKLEVN